MTHGFLHDVVRKAEKLFAEQLVKKKWDGEVYATIRENLYPELYDVLGLTYKSCSIKTLIFPGS